MLAAIAALACLASTGCGSGSETTEAPDEVAPEARAAAPIERVPEDSAEGEPLLQGGDKVVVAGDSLALTGSSLPYPERLGAELGAELDVVNLSEPGTTTRDWLPKGALFDRELAPALEGADLLLLTLGGNDLESALGATSGPAGLGAAGSPEAGTRLLAEFKAISRRLGKIIAAARRENGELRVAYVSYPDYSRAEAFTQGLNRLEVLAFRTGLERLSRSATRADPDVFVDLLTKTSEANVDRLLADPEHLGDAGHDLYAKTIVSVLGGGGSG